MALRVSFFRKPQNAARTRDRGGLPSETIPVKVPTLLEFTL